MSILDDGPSSAINGYMKLVVPTTPERQDIAWVLAQIRGCGELGELAGEAGYDLFTASGAISVILEQLELIGA